MKIKVGEWRTMSKMMKMKLLFANANLDIFIKKIKSSPNE